MTTDLVVVAVLFSPLLAVAGVAIVVQQLRRHVDHMADAIEGAFERRDRKYAKLEHDVEQLRHPPTKHEAVTVELPRAIVVRRRA